jgi:cephalosporin hydroxylase
MKQQVGPVMRRSVKSWLRPLHRRLGTYRRTSLAAMIDHERSSLSRRSLLAIQHGTLRYQFNGVPCQKNPFDLALYLLLMTDLRPGTIIEIGSHRGGSALWFAAQARVLALDTHVYSLDLQVVTDVRDDDVSFLEGDIHHLDASALPQVLASCRRPLLVIEDGPHTYEGTLAALRFFCDHLEPGDYLVVEDGVLKSFGRRYRRFRNGPNRAVRTFLAETDGMFEIDRLYCDYFGRNVTWNTNGYLKRTGRAIDREFEPTAGIQHDDI